MDNYEENLQQENIYLEETLSVIAQQLEYEENKILSNKQKLVAARRDMYENTCHSADDFDKNSETVQYLNPLAIQTFDYQAREERIEELKKLLISPYFARIDFYEKRYGKESIYIGIASLINDETYDTYIYDWRAPISSIFYRYEIGEVSYQAPCGKVTGEVSLKRQYEIKNSKLQYFFDSSVNIMDDILKKVLSGNTSSKMKSIVETIQREQDMVIRDIENDLVIVQGVAGSGKTSVALHRVAFLMYQGLTSKLSMNNIVLISPNSLFDKYISNVLPELGEKNVSTLTFEDIFTDIFEGRIEIKSRNSLLEKIITAGSMAEKELLKSGMEFKLSKNFILILDVYLNYFEHRIIEISDVYYNGEYIADRQLLKAELIHYNKVNMPLEKRLSIIEARIMKKLQESRKTRLPKLEKFASNYQEHRFEIKPFARLLSVKQSATLQRIIYKFTRLDVAELYKKLFKSKELFYRISKGIELPSNIEQILDYTNCNLQDRSLCYEDGIALLYLKLKMSGGNSYKDIKQVVVDETQDYYPLHFEVLKHLYVNAKYTIMGDINQTIEKNADLTIYHDIKTILSKKKTTTVFMTKSFRCSYEINTFSSQFIDANVEIESFDRHEDVPEIHKNSCNSEMEFEIIKGVAQYQKEGYESIAIICKSMCEAKCLFESIGKSIGATLLNESVDDTSIGVVLVPIYMAKGLEFDGVIIYQTNNENYKTEDDKKLLYIASTRALHKLSLYYTGHISKLITVGIQSHEDL
ncbi:AAA family ATPase [Clostridium sp. CF012]|uniref:HelD family protein n=1 Tax=Clostridium sp. CF012 TaxID=2843319 RepID=UPI001C0D0C4C|nr:AAA family ATPase [Clostridium sp. CF012]MBU3144061.1 AAA family ATPase [Clostridium sp. CF012]